MANVQEQATGGSLSFSAQEVEHYRHILSLVDTEGTGLITGTTCGSFLSVSGLPDTVLAEIWQIADANEQGFLTVEAFFVALRLVAHAQAHSQPSRELAMVSPPTLPEFLGLQHRAVVEQQSPRGCSVAVSGQGAASDDEWQPVISGSLDPPQVQPQGPPCRFDGATPSLCSSGTNPRRPFNSQDWIPTTSEKTEYLSLFRACDADSDGFVQGDEAQTLLERSGLDSYLLAIAWEHADQDKDGRLTFKEFVTLIHLVTCTLRGAQLPSQVEGLPQELFQAVDEMVLQEGASSVIPCPMTTNNAPPEEAAVVVDGMPAEWNQPWPDAGQETATAFTEGVGEEDHAFAAFANTASAFNDVVAFGDASAAFDNDDSFAKSSAAVDSGAFPHAEHTSAVDETSAADALNGDEAAASGPLDVGTFNGAFVKQGEDMKELHDFQTRAITDVTANLEASTAMDKDLVRQLQLDVVELEEELQSVQQSQNEQVAQAVHERESQQRQTSMVIELERDLQDTKKHHHRLRERCNHVRINSEINFLKKMLDEQEQSLQDVLRVSCIIEKSWKDVQAGTEAIEGQRKLIQRQVAAEEELLRQAKRQNAEMTTRVERFRRQQVAVATESHEEHEHARRLRDIKAGTAADAAPKTGRQVSWNGDHITSHLTTAFTGSNDVGRPILRTAVLVGGREGV